MKDSSRCRKEVSEAILNAGGAAVAVDKELKRAGHLIAGLIIRYERMNRLGKVDLQFEFYSWLLELSRSVSRGRAQSLAQYVLWAWAQRTRNVFGMVYCQAYEDGYIVASHYTRKTFREIGREKRIRHVGKAVDSRKQIGESTSQAIAVAARKYRKLSKEEASIRIGEDIGKAPGTVKRYLTKLFPGGLWGSE